MSEVGPFDAAEWEAWLDEHHEVEREVWLVSWKKATGRQALPYGTAVEVAARFGWVDGMEKSIDAERFTQRWTPRRPNGNWTARNRALAERLVASGEMRPAGLRAVEAAKASGAWERARVD
ncbi:MAG: YdeI/OmpD-associated family protein [Gaiellaceae bacterium]